VSDGPYKIGSLARATGFAPALLRAWERRFGLLAPERGPGGQRLYTDADLRVLQAVRMLMSEGRAIGEIARLGRQRLLASHPATMPTSTAPFGLSAAPALEWRERLVRAALSLDDRSISATLDEATAALGTDHMVEDIMVPVAIEVGRLWDAGTCSVASEHLISDQFLHRLRRLLDAAQPEVATAPAAVAACFPTEQHQLGVAILAWRLARRGVRVTYLGSALPVADLAAACHEVRPLFVVLSVTRAAPFRTHYPALVAGVATGAIPVPLWIGGQGIPEDASLDAPNGITLVRELAGDTLDRITTGARPARAGARARRGHRR